MENTKTGFGARLADAGKSALNSYGSVLIAIVALSVVWAIASPFFLTAANLKNIGVYMSASGIIAAGVTVSMLLGGLDLSQMSIMAFSGMVVGVSYRAGVGGPVLMLIAMAVGVLCGVLNGLVMNYMRISPIITTLGTSMVFRDMAYIVSNGNLSVQNGRIASAGIAGYFEEIFISQKIGFDKPRKEFFDACFARIPGFDRQRSIIVGDSLTSDIRGGINAGIKTCWYNPRGKAARADIRPDYCITALHELPGLLSRIFRS